MFPAAFRRSSGATLWVILFCCCEAACHRGPEPPSTLSVAAAADLRFAMDELAADFHRTHPAVTLRPSYGSSGNFYAQIRNGAPFDVFLSADVVYPRRLAQEGVAKPESIFLYGLGRIVVWVPAGSAVDPAAALGSPRIRHIAIANPQHAPYGRGAEAALHTLGLYDAAKPKLVMGEDVAQTFSFVESGAADAGIVALSLALAPQAHGKGRYWEIPLDDYPRMEQGGMILKDSPGAQAFRAYLTSAGGRAILKKYGFYLPEGY